MWIIYFAVTIVFEYYIIDKLWKMFLIGSPAKVSFKYAVFNTISINDGSRLIKYVKLTVAVGHQWTIQTTSELRIRRKATGH